MSRFIIITFAIWRILLFILAFLGTKIIPIFGAKFPYSKEMLVSTGLPNWLWSFANFDGVHYLTIARSGYSAQYTQAFFPLFPLLIRFLGNILAGNYLVAGLIISNLSLIGVLWILSKLLLLDFRTDQVKWMIIFFLFYPFSFFLGSLYNESLFLFFLLASFYLVRGNNWRLGGILGGLASAARLVGIFLLPALIWEWYINIKNHLSNIKNRSQKSNIHKSSITNYQLPITNLLSLFIIPTGLVVYMIYLQLAFHDPLYFLHTQPFFGASRTSNQLILLPQVLFRYLRIFLTVSYHHYDFWVAVWEFVSFVFCGVLLVVGYVKKMRLSYLIFGVLAILTPTLTGTLSSMPRYTLVAFPMFIVLGLVKSKIWKVVLVSLSTVLLAVFTILFTRGYWVS